MKGKNEHMVAVSDYIQNAAHKMTRKKSRNKREILMKAISMGGKQS